MAERDDTQSKSRIQLPILSLMANANRLTVVRDQAKPRKLGRYELEERLGSEGAIETFRARVRGLAGFDRIFAIKCLRRGRGGPINLADPFIKIAKRTAGINDPRVARVLDADVIDGVAIAVTEFVHGLDLDRFREWAHVSGVLATGIDESAEKWQKMVAYIGAEVAGGLAALHALAPPLVHGGLCPRNIIVTARGGVKVLDVGLRQSAQGSDEPLSPRALAYAAPDPSPDPSAAEPQPTSDVRALGVVLFELATGELPPLGSGSLAARKILDALWPSMADFVAGLLAEDAAMRPSAAEAAKILSDFWSDIPDASMVAEMAVMVRNFSGFVADANAPHTPHPLPLEPSKEDAPLAPRTQVPFVLPPGPHVSLPSGSFLAAGDTPTRAMPSGSYASAIFQAVPTDASLPNFADETLEMDLSADAWVSASQGADLDPAVDEAHAVAFPTAPELDHGIALPPTLMEPSGPETTVDPVPIPELAEWGAQALAALGDQAGVSIQPLAPAPELAIAGFETTEVAPPPVHDPVIEEAFAFLPPPPPAEAEPPPPTLARNTLMAVLAVPVKHTLLMSSTHQPLEDDLIDDPHEPDAIMASAFVEQSATEKAASEPPLVETVAFQLEGETIGDRALEASAFVAEETTHAEEWAPPRLAHAMAAPEADEVRGPQTREARRSGTDSAARERGDENVAARPSRAKRLAIVIAIIAGVGGAVAAAVVTVRPAGKKGAHPALPALSARPGQAAFSSVAPSVLPDHAVPKAFTATELPVPAPAATALAVTAPAVAAPAVVASKPAAAASSISVPIASKPDGAMVWIDGEERCRTPCTVKLKPGSARLALVHAGYLSSQSPFDVRDGATVDATLVSVEPPMAGDARFRAECKTQGKLPIVVDGKETGVLCPYSKMRVEPGSHTIGVLVPSTGRVHDKEITLSAGVRSVNFGD
jgi:serine/threonine protein kinase